MKLVPWSEALPLPPTRRKILLGCSGGADSTALAWLLHEAGHRRVVLCHLHHGLRATEADGDATFVRRLATRLGFGFQLEKVDVQTLATARHQSVEWAAREARRHFFHQCARRERTRILLLAHHADDQVETILHHFLRGSGRRGLGGMRSHSPAGRSDPTLEIWRPLLGVSHAQLQDYLRQRRRSWREDSSNASLEPTRNRLRHQILPALRQTLGREIQAPLLRLAEILRDEDDFLEQLLPPDQPTWETRFLTQLPLALQRRLLLRWLNQAQPSDYPPCGWKEVEAARQLLQPTGPAKINLPGGRHLRRRAGLLFIENPA